MHSQVEYLGRRLFVLGTNTRYSKANCVANALHKTVVTPVLSEIIDPPKDDSVITLSSHAQKKVWGKMTA